MSYKQTFLLKSMNTSCLFPTEDCYHMPFDEVMPQAITTFDCHFDEVVPNLAQFLNEKAEQNSYDWELHEAYDT